MKDAGIDTTKPKLFVEDGDGTGNEDEVLDEGVGQAGVVDAAAAMK